MAESGEFLTVLVRRVLGRGADEVETGKKPQCLLELLRFDVETRILHLQLRRLQRRVLHLRRERMLDGVAKDPEADGCTLVLDRAPIPEIFERVGPFHGSV